MSKSVARRSSTASNKPKSKQRADFMKAMGVKKANLSFDEWQAFLLVLCHFNEVAEGARGTGPGLAPPTMANPSRL
jgi:hypothetical protein